MYTHRLPNIPCEGFEEEEFAKRIKVRQATFLSQKGLIHLHGHKRVLGCWRRGEERRGKCTGSETLVFEITQPIRQEKKPERVRDKTKTIEGGGDGGIREQANLLLLRWVPNLLPTAKSIDDLKPQRCTTTERCQHSCGVVKRQASTNQ